MDGLLALRNDFNTCWFLCSNGCLPHFLLVSSGCLACLSKDTSIISADVPTKRIGVKGQVMDKQSKSEEFWSTSTFDIDRSSKYQSVGSIPSVDASNHVPDPHGGTSSAGSPEFINHGLLVWKQTRNNWVGRKTNENRSQQVREPKLSWNATYESLLGSNKPFRHPIPLSEMVDFLVDIWEQDVMCN